MRGKQIPEAFWRPQALPSFQPETTAPALSSLATVALMGLGLLALEITNAATSYWALADLMGNAGLLSVSFSLMLTLGLAALDTGGLMRLFGPQGDETTRSAGLWFVAGGWLLCATFNALATWWAMASAMSGHVVGNALLSATELLDVAPPFLAIVLWVMRVLLVAGYAQGERG
jgi:hypothetical protein